MRRLLVVAGGLMLLVAAFLLGGRIGPHGNAPTPESAVPATVPPSPTPSPTPAASPAPTAPNIVWVVLDACRFDHLSCYGYGRQTSPSIDALAQAGVLFENNYTQGMMTTLSVPAYMTGQFLPTYSMFHPEGRAVPRVAPQDEKLAPEILRENGYTTLCFSGHPGISPPSRLMKAFDKGVLVPSPDRFPAPTLAHMLPQIESALASDVESGKPFFLYVHAMDTHFPHRGEGRFSADTYASDDIKNGMPLGESGCSFDAEEQECLRSLHDGSIEGADRSFGRLRALLDKKGLGKNTVYVVTSDHGELLGEDGTHWGHEYTIADPVLRTPLVMAGPGLPAGSRVRGLTRSIDILPTLLELAGARTQATMQGVSLMPVVRGEKAETGEPVFSRAGTYEENCVFLLINREHRYEYTVDTGEGHVFAASDAVRSELTDVPDAVKSGYLAEMKERLLPLWDKYLANPRMFHVVRFDRQFDLGWVSPAESVVARTNGAPDAAEETDNRWTFSDGLLWAANPTEKAPPLTLRIPVDPGRYSVLVILGNPKPAGALPGSSVAVQLAGGMPVDATWVPLPREHMADNYVAVGEASFDDGTCQVTIAPGAADRWSAVAGVKFMRIDGGTVQEGGGVSGEELQEKLKALGYVN